MTTAERQTRSHLIKLFAQQGINPRKQFGQNFLIDLNLVEFIAGQAELSRDDVVLEVGTGTGSLTAYLASAAGAVVSVEIDRVMHGLAQRSVLAYDNVTLLECDVLEGKNTLSPRVVSEVEPRLSAGSGRRLKLVANLPYNVATPVVSNLVATELPWTRMVITIQLELAERMIAAPGTREYSALSAWLQAQCKIEILKRLPPSVFWPEPKVSSAIVLITPDEAGRNRIENRAFFHDFLRRVFQQRRKLLRPVVRSMYRKEMEKAEIDTLLSDDVLDPNVRAEEMDAAWLVALANRVWERVQRGRVRKPDACQE